MVENIKLSIIEKHLNNPRGMYNTEKRPIITSEKNKKVLLKYAKFLFEQDLSEVTVKARVIHIRTLLNGIKKDANKINKSDIKNYIDIKRNEIKPSSFNVTKSEIKLFFKWLYNVEEKNQYPDIVKWIPVKFVQGKEIRDADLITLKEVQDILIPCCKSSRDEALISFLQETGARINEILSIDVSDLRIENDRAFVRLRNSKRRNNEKSYREAVLIDSYYPLQHWLIKHRLLKENPNKKDVPLFINRRGVRLLYSEVQRVLKNLKEDANFKKPINAHQFRHSQATNMSKLLSDAEMRVWGGWSKSSQIVSRYTHLTSGDINDKILKSIGRVKEDEIVLEKENMQPCPRCHELNDYNKFSFCGKCGMSLKKETEVKENVRVDMLSDKVEELLKIFKEQEKAKILRKLKKLKK